MSTKFIIVILILTLISGFIFLIKFTSPGQMQSGLTGTTTDNPIQKVTLTPTPTPTQLPIIYNFDKSTDLKSELETINPQVMDSDFDDFKKISFPLGSGK